MGTGFRLDRLSSEALVAGAVVLLGVPVALFVIVLVSDAPTWVAWWGSLTLLYYFVFGAYAYARYGREPNTPAAEKP